MIKFAILAVPSLLAAMLFDRLANDFSVIAAVPAQRSAFEDRQFMAALEARDWHARQDAAADRAFLSKLEFAESLTKKIPIMVPENHPTPGGPEHSPVIRRATLVSPPRSAPPIATSRTTPAIPVAPQVRRAEAVNGTPRTAAGRASVIIYQGKVITTRATAMN